MDPLQPSPRATRIQAVISRMEDQAAEPPPPPPHQGTVGGPPSDSEIEQVIKSAMALAGKGASRAGTPGRDEERMETRMQHGEYQQYQAYTNPAFGVGPAPSGFPVHHGKPVSLPLFSESFLVVVEEGRADAASRAALAYADHVSSCGGGS